MVSDADMAARPLSSFEAERNEAATGEVYLIGVGSGELLQLTLLAVRTIQIADEIIIGQNVDESLVIQPEISLPAGVQLWKYDDLAEIEQVISLAQHSKRVAWLVKGDPLLDGHLAKYNEALRCANIKIQVVPGMPTRQIAGSCAGAYFDQPVVLYTDRVDQRTRSGTIFTTVKQLPKYAEQILEAGWPPNTPTVLVLNYTTKAQSTITTTARKMVKMCKEERDLPLLIVLGKAASRGTELNWFESQSLFGWQILIPRTKGLSGLLERSLESYGALTIQIPTLAIEPPRNEQPLQRAIQGLVDGNYQWLILNSPYAVKAIFERLAAYGLDARMCSGLRIAAIGEDTVQECKACGILPDLIPQDDQTNNSLAQQFPAYDDLLDPINGVLIVRADVANDELVRNLTQLGWEVDDVVAYRIIRAAPPSAEVRENIKGGHYDAVVFTSETAVRNMVGIAGKPHSAMVIAAIGPASAAACEEVGLAVDLIASKPEVAVLAEELANLAAKRRAGQLLAGVPVRRPSQRRRRRSKPASQNEEL